MLSQFYLISDAGNSTIIFEAIARTIFKVSSRFLFFFFGTKTQTVPTLLIVRILWTPSFYYISNQVN